MNKDQKRTPPFQSKLNPHKADILSAWAENKTLHEIRDDLFTKGISISLSGLSRFIRCRLRRKNPHEVDLRASEAPAPTKGLPVDFKEQLERIAAMDPVEMERKYALRRMKEQNQ